MTFTLENVDKGASGKNAKVFHVNMEKVPLFVFSEYWLGGIRIILKYQHKKIKATILLTKIGILFPSTWSNLIGPF